MSPHVPLVQKVSNKCGTRGGAVTEFVTQKHHDFLQEIRRLVAPDAIFAEWRALTDLFPLNSARQGPEAHWVSVVVLHSLEVLCDYHRRFVRHCRSFPWHCSG